jgi:hypothetical protein
MPEEKSNSAASLVCEKCNRELVLGDVTASYMGQTFPVKLLKCAGCGMVFVPEDLALGKMLQVEQALEDK